MDLLERENKREQTKETIAEAKLIMLFKLKKARRNTKDINKTNVFEDTIQALFKSKSSKCSDITCQKYAES